MGHDTVQPLFGEGLVQEVTEVFDEIGIAIEAHSAFNLAG